MAGESVTSSRGLLATRRLREPSSPAHSQEKKRGIAAKTGHQATALLSVMRLGLRARRRDCWVDAGENAPGRKPLFGVSIAKLSLSGSRSRVIVWAGGLGEGRREKKKASAQATWRLSLKPTAPPPPPLPMGEEVECAFYVCTSTTAPSVLCGRVCWQRSGTSAGVLF